jgi:F0F1-type ATP synthase assembly protein I
MNSDGTRLIFWLDLLVLLIAVILFILHQWDWLVALVIGLVIMNYFDHIAQRRQDP